MLAVSTNAPARAATRLPYIDALRGLAVVLMILLHAADGWLRPGLKDGLGWQTIRTLGGQAAPLFFLLAGAGIGIGWGARASRPGPRREAARRMLWSRGFEIILAGYGLRLVMWWIDGGSIVRPSGWLGGGGLALGYFALWQGLPHRRALRPEGASWSGSRSLAAGTVACALALSYLAAFDPKAHYMLMRPDVLHTIGASMVLIAALEPVLYGRAWLACTLAISVTLVTSGLSSALPGPLPAAIAGYIAPFVPAPGTAPAGRFPLFPWLAHALAGAGFGQVLGRAAAHGAGHDGLRAGERAAIEWAVLGAVLALLCCESVPQTASLLVNVPWLTPTVRVGYRVGLSMVLAALCVGLAAPQLPWQRSLLALGRASLAVYCVHLELAFGLAAHPVRKALGYPAFLIGAALLIGAMTGFAHLWLGWRAGRARVAEARAA